MQQPLLSLQEIVVTRSRQVVLDVPRLDVYPQEVLTIIGPNGSGKSTLLQVIAGLLPYRGSVLFDGRPVRPGDLGYRRQIALVLQEPLLLDMSVLANATLGLHFQGVHGKEARRQAMDWLERLGVAHLSSRPARALSGGEAQRVSLARAFALKPRLLLLDEPFSALDAPTRAILMGDLHHLLRQTGTTAIFVTHNQEEALQLGDRLAVLLGGRLRQLDRPEQVFAFPADEDVAAFVGVGTVIPGRIVGFKDGLAMVQAAHQQVLIPADNAIGDEVLVCLRPEDITLIPGDTPLPSTSARNQLRGRVERISPYGCLYRITLDCGFRLVALITPHSLEELDLEEGKQVVAIFKATAAHAVWRKR